MMAAEALQKGARATPAASGHSWSARTYSQYPQSHFDRSTFQRANCCLPDSVKESEITNIIKLMLTAISEKRIARQSPKSTGSNLVLVFNHSYVSSK